MTTAGVTPVSVATQAHEAKIVTPAQLVWRKFRRHRLAMVGAVLTISFYLIAAFAPFFAPFGPNEYQSKYTYAPPQPIKWMRTSPEGRTIFGPHVQGLTVKID